MHINISILLIFFFFPIYRLFGNEDVDLRKLAPPPPSNKQTQSVINQQSKPPSPPPPPVISPTDGTSWAKYKEARKSEGIVDSPRKRTHSTRETFDRLGRPLLYHRLISGKLFFLIFHKYNFLTT